MEFRILGPLEVLDNGHAVDVGGAKQRALLACLLLHANEVVSADRLIDALWEEQPPETAQKALQVYVSQLRKALGKERLETKAPGYRLRVEAGELDRERFGRLLEEGKPHEALVLWRGPPLAEFAYQRFAQTEIARLEELRLSCLEARFEDDLARGRHAALVGELEALVREHPLRERLRAHLMLALYRAGRQAQALEVYQQGRTFLSEELGLEPGEALKDLQRAILAHDPTLDLDLPRAEPGAPLEDELGVAAARPSATREARKPVTVLSWDLTATEPRLDPESLRRLQERGFDVLVPVLERHGASVERSLGGSVTAIFGIPTVHEDDAERAVRAAVEMRARLAELHDELEGTWAASLELRGGIGSGEVLAGGDGGQPYVTGEPVQTALRLQQVAQAGELLLDERTLRLVRDTVEADEVGDRIRLLDIRPDAREHLRRFDSPMVGRERERRRLSDAFGQAAGDRSCQLFTVLGAAGVGKSRLVQEFLNDLGSDALVARGRCLPYGEGITYWPVIEAVRDAAELDAASSPEESLGKIAAVVEDEQDGALAAHGLGEVIGLTEELSGAEERFWAVRTFFEALARQRPLVLVFDDIHWAEPTFLDLVDHIADWTRDAPLLLVCVARPELLDARPHWGGGKLNATSVLLEPLSDGESVELVDNLASAVDLESDARRRIVDTAGGNPLFVEEMVALLLEDGRVDLAVAVPPTIQALLAARLDRLVSAERAAIEAASVEGQVFHEASVAALVSADVHDDLQTLVRRELIRTDRPVFTGERGYRFRHLLIRDAAYESIPKDSRATLHEQHAEWLERSAGDRLGELEEILGYHLEQAFRYRSELGPIDDTAWELGRRGAVRLGAAGRRAFTRVDAPAAVNLISRAIALLRPDDPLRVDLVPNVRAIQGTSDLEWAEAILNDAISTGDPRVTAHARVQQGFLQLFFASSEADAEQLIRVADDAIAVFEEKGDDLGLARAWRLIAQAHYLARRGESSAAAARHAFEFGRRAGDQIEQLETVEWLGIALLLGPTPAAEGTRQCERLLQAVSGDQRLEATLFGALAYMEGIQGHAEEASAYIERGKQSMKEIGDSAWLFPVLLAFYFGWVSEPVSAERDLRPVYEGLKRIGEKSHFCSLATMLARAVYDQGRYEEAGEIAEEARRTARPNDVHSHIVWRSTRAKVLARRGDLVAAEALAREAIAFAEKSDFLHSRGDALADLAEVLRLADRPDEAAEALERAIEPYEQKGNVLAVARTRALLDELRASAV
jgi:DNA-binding SARP family transcriptional activator/tetratricopeptide (TPR) repeat protein